MDREIITDVGKRIARTRKLRNLTQAQLGEMIGTKQGIISSWEMGKFDPGTDNLMLISRALGVSPAELLGYHPEGVTEIIMPDSSMEPVIHQGDILTVDQTEGAPPDGSIVLADTKDKKGIIRRLFRAGVQIMLLAANPSIPPICVHYADIRGKVTDIHRKL